MHTHKALVHIKYFAYNAYVCVRAGRSGNEARTKFSEREEVEATFTSV